MDYKGLKQNYFDNLNVDDQDSRDLRFAKTDFNNTLAEMYYKAQAPEKSKSYNIKKTQDIVEDFADTTYITGLTFITTNGVVSGGKVTYPPDGIDAVIEVSGLNIINQVDIKVGGTASSPPITNFATATIKVLTEDKLTELFSEAIKFTDTTGAEELLSVLPGQTGVNMVLQITLTRTLDYDDYFISNLDIQIDKNSLTLPEDFFIPLEVIFTGTDGNIIASNEMPYERYSRWTPKTLSAGSFVTTEADPLNKIYSTSENAEFDRTIGYFFNVESNGITFNWKPKFDGIITLVYAYLPTTTSNDGTVVELNRAFYEVLSNGATQRGLLRGLKKAKSNMTDVQLNALVIGYREYKSKYKQGLSDFIGFTKQTSEPFVIKAQDFLNDMDMLRI